MDQSTLVGNDVSEGRRFVERFAADGNPVDAAFWAKEEEGFWHLYVVTDLVEREGTTAVYRAVHASLDKLPDCRVASSEIKAIGPNNPIAKDALEIANRYPRSLARGLGGRSLGATWFDHMYIYHPRTFTFTQVNLMTTEDISRELLRLMNRGPGILQPSRVSLKDGTTFSGVPFSLDLGPQNAMLVRFIADGEAAPRVVRLDEIASVS